MTTSMSETPAYLPQIDDEVRLLTELLTGQNVSVCSRTLGPLLRQYRRVMQISTTTLADQCHATPDRLYGVENGVSGFSHLTSRMIEVMGLEISIRRVSLPKDEE